MSQVLINFRMEEDDKNRFERVCKEMGMSMSTAFTIFAKKVVREKKIPFEVEADPFHFDDEYVSMEELMAEMNFNKLNEE